MPTDGAPTSAGEPPASHVTTPERTRVRDASEHAAVPSAASVVELVAHACATHADALAAAGVGEPLDYATLWERASRLAGELIARGVAPEDRIGLWAQQSTELLVSMVGILAAGAAYVPLDPAFPSQRLALIANDAKLRLVVAPRRARARAEEIVDTVISPGDARDEPVALPAVGPSNAAYVIYTSGSTGRPKGVIVEHGSLVAMFGWMRRTVPVAVGDRFIGTASPAFDASVPYLLYPIVSGGTYVAIDADVATDPNRLAALIEDVRPRVMVTLPAMLRMLTETRWKGDDRLDVWTGGERTAADVIAYLAPRVRTLRNWYGPTEATVAVTTGVLGPADADAPIGTWPSHVRIVLLDRDGRPVGIDEPGELYVVGGALARGYLNDPGLTSSRFVSIDLDGAPERAYRTGDLARLRDDGSLVILGRVDEQINLRGYRVEPAEVEAACMTHAGVRDAVVVARRTDDGDATLHAVVAVHGDLDGAAVREHVRGLLPAHLVPATVTVVDALPLTATGKVDRRAAAELHAAEPRPRPRFDASASPEGTALERDVVAAFAEVLDRAPSHVGLDDDFFELGGTSLRAVRLFVLLDERLGARLPLSVLANAATPRALAAAVRSHAHHPARDGTPRHEWERVLSGLYCEQLGVGHVDRGDSFFALGGSVEDASRLLDELRSRYDVDVALDELAAAPSVAALARLVGRRSRRDVLVPLTTTGTGPPLFLIAGAGGLAITFLPLARLLGPAQPCFGLQAHGIERRGFPDLTLDAGARRYAAAIREVQPHGPYLLGGHSLGGVHALKVAQRLAGEGEEVALLAIFDTPLSATMAGRGVERASGRQRAPAGAPPLRFPRLGTLVHLPFVGLIRYRGTAQFDAFAALGEIQATLARPLAPWGGRAMLLLSDEEEAALIDERWSRVLRGPVTRARVPGGHIAMLERANVAAAVPVLRAEIARATDPASRPAHGGEGR